MADVRYHSWSLLALDNEPESGQPTTFNPPMLANLALDPGASLVLEIESPVPAVINLAVRTTALSSDEIASEPFRVFSGERDDHYSERPQPDWEKSAAGLEVTFAASLPGLSRFLKLVAHTSKTIVISGVALRDQ